MKKAFLVLILSLTFPALEAKAQGVTLYAGYLNPGVLNLQNIRNDLNIRGTGVYGARFELDFHRVLGLEEDFGFSPRLFTSTLIPSASDVRGFLYSSNLVLNAPIGRLVPYATAGVGLMKPFGSGFHPFDAKFAGNYGGGIKFERLAGALGLRFDVRGYSITNVDNQTLNILEVSGGLLFNFGK